MIFQEFEQLWEDTLKTELLSLEGMRIQQRRAIIAGVSAALIVAGASTFLSGVVDVGIPFFIAAVAGFLTFFVMRPAGYRKLYKEKVVTALTKYTRYKWAPDMSYYGQLFLQKAKTAPIRELFILSGLYYSSITSFRVDEVFIPENLPSRMAEVEAVRGSGKNQHTFFKGLIFDFDISRNFTGETYIRAEKELGVSMGTASSRALFSSTLKTTQLEWNDFEKLLDVQTSNEVEAREILDPQFMEALFTWWSEHKKSVRVSFKGHHLYLSIPFFKNLFEPSPFSSLESHKKELWEYLGALLLAEQLFALIEHKYRLDMQKGKVDTFSV